LWQASLLGGSELAVATGPEEDAAVLRVVPTCAANRSSSAACMSQWCLTNDTSELSRVKPIAINEERASSSTLVKRSHELMTVSKGGLLAPTI